MKAVLLSLLALFCLVLSACSNVAKAEAVADEALAEMNKLADVLEQVAAGDLSAEDGTEQAEAIIARIEELEAQGDEIKVTTEEKAELEAKYEDELNEVAGRMIQAGMSLAMSGNATPELLETLDSIGD